MKLSNATYLIIFLFSFIGSLSAQTYREFVALHELHQKTNGEQWNSAWDLNSPVNTWDGVVVKDGHVVALDLSDNNLEGELPMTLVNLRHLKKLNLSGNKLTGKLPRGMGRWCQLENLNIANNLFTGSIPKGFSKMNELKYLQLADNDFDDYGRLDEIKDYQLLAFDMADEFMGLNLMNIDKQGRLANSAFEDIEQ